MKKRKYLIFSILIVIGFTATAQESINDFLKSVEQNSIYLKAERQDADARITGSRMDIAPENPEASYSYMPGIKGTVGTRKAYSVSQNIEWFGKYFAKSKMGKLEREQAEVQFTGSRREILLNAKLLSYNIVYLKKQKNLLSARLKNAEKLFSSTQMMFDKGEATALDLNKAKIFLTSVKSSYLENSSLISLAEEQLTVAANRKDINTDNFLYIENVEVNFANLTEEALFENPNIKISELDSAKSQKNISIQRAATLPSFSIGLAGEMVTNTDNFRGVSAGISIPLWGGINKVKTAKAEALAASYRTQSRRLEVESSLKEQVTKINIMKENISNFSSLNDVRTGQELLQKNFDLRNITMTSYLTDLQFYYDAEDSYLSVEFDLNSSIARLLIYRL